MGVLDDLGISDDGRVATFAWNTARHLELYFAAPCTGRVLHTLNIRLFPEQVTYIVNHAEDEVIFVDRSLTALLWPLLPTFKTVRHVVVMDDGRGDQPSDAGSADLHDYETLLAAASPVEFHVTDENRAASMCYTSGTTGNPKGVVYSHRSSWLHTFAATGADSIGIRESDRVLPVVPMFHANAWGLAHAGVATGATLIMPGPDLSPKALADLIVEERVTVPAGVPTIFMGVLPRAEGPRHLVAAGHPVRRLRGAQGPVGGLQGAGGAAHLPGLGHDRDEPGGHRRPAQVHAGRPLRGGAGRPAHHHRPPARRRRAARGRPRVARDPAARRHQPRRDPGPGPVDRRGRTTTTPARPSRSRADGWLKTGDVATWDAEGYLRIVDRTKDVVKSGGEWISSVDLENELMAHPKIAEAAVIGVKHPKWSERPLACVVVKPGETLTKDEVIAFLEPRVAKWWLPDDVVFIDEVPKTSVGKFSKKTLRDQFADYQLPTA